MENKNKKIDNTLKQRFRAIEWKKVIIGLLAIFYLMFSTISMLTRCTTVSASSVGNSNSKYVSIIPFSTITYHGHSVQTNKVYNIDMPQLASDKNSNKTFYNTFVEATTALTTEYNYQYKQEMPQLYTGVVDNRDGNTWIQFTITNIESSATANTDHTNNVAPYINYYRIQIIPEVYYNGSVLGAEYRIFGGYDGTEYPNTSTLVYSQYYAVNSNDDGSTSVSYVSTWYYDPYTLTNFTSVIDFYEDSNQLMQPTVSLDYGTTLAEVRSAMQLITTRTVKIENDSIDIETAGLHFIHMGTGLIDGGSSYKATYKIPLSPQTHTWISVDTIKYDMSLLAKNFILDYEQYSKAGAVWDSEYGLKVKLTQNGIPYENVEVIWNVTQVFQTESITTGAKTLTSLTREIRISNEQSSIDSDIYNLRFPIEELTEEYRTAGYDISNNIPRYWCVNSLTVKITTGTRGEFDTDNYIELIIPYINTTTTNNDIWNWYNERIGSGYKGGADGTLTAPQDFFEWLIIAVDGFLSAPIIGIISLGEILWFCVGIGILFAVLKYFAGG